MPPSRRLRAALAAACALWTLPAAAETAADPGAPALQGIVLLPAAAAVRAEGGPAAGVVTGAVAVDNPARLAEALRPLLGQPIAAELLSELPRRVVAALREQHRPMVDVAIPAGQDVSDGVIQVVVTEFRVGRLAASGNRWFSEAVLTDAVSLAPGDRIDDRVLKRDLARLNENPFRQVDVVYRKNDTPGTTDVVLRTVDRFPLEASASLDNSGTASTGRTRWTAGVSWGNVLGLDHRASYRYISSSRFWYDHDGTAPGRSAPLTQTHAADYAVPLPWGDTLALNGNHTRSDPRTGNALFRSTGINEGAGLSYGTRLGIGDDRRVDLRGAWDIKRTNNNLAFGGDTVSATSWVVSQFTAGAATSFSDSLGSTSLDLSLTVSPGGMLGGNSDSRFEFGRAGAKARYAVGRLSVQRQTPLPGGFIWTLSATGQLANQRLVPSEQLTVGGLGTVRGFEVGAISGDNGVAGGTELRAPSLSPLQWAGLGLQDSLTLLGFVDAAHVRTRAATAGELPRATLASAGLGVQYGIGRHLSLSAHVAWPVHEPAAAPPVRRRIHFSVGLRS